MKGIIKEYLESQARIDPCFKEKYDETQLDKCIDFIYEHAELLVTERTGKQCVQINDETVFKWARDFFNDGTAALEAEKERKEEEEKKRREEEAKKRAQEAAEEAKKKAIEERNKREHENGQLTIFDLMGA